MPASSSSRRRGSIRHTAVPKAQVYPLAFLFLAIALNFTACTDYVAEIDDRYGEWETASVTPQSSDSETSVSTGTMTDSRDGLTYKTVTIGTQTWMAENLNYETSGSYCYDDNASYCSKYGRLYTWAAAMDSVGTLSTNGKGCGYGTTCSPTYPVRGVCPEGWHLPTQTEWNTLITAVGGQSTAGNMLKSTNGWYSSGNGTDAYSFSALPAGGRYYDGYYDLEGIYAYFWSSTELDSDYAYYMYLYYGDGSAGLDRSLKNIGFSVRCLQDEGETVQSSSSVTQQSSDSETSVSTGTMTDSRDGQTYKTVTIGIQTWMAQNLNYETANSYCYKDSASYCTKYGRLYKWAAAMDSVGTWSTNGKGCGYNKTCSPTYPVRGVCPEGWHLPTEEEFETLFTAVGGQSIEVLKSTSGWNSSDNGTDAFAFSALPAGDRFDFGDYYGEGFLAYFWSSTEINSGVAYFMNLLYDFDDADLYNYNKNFGFSVRCLQDDVSGQTAESSSSVTPASSGNLPSTCDEEGATMEYEGFVYVCSDATWNYSGPSISQSSSSSAESSSLVTLATPCKTETEDNCEYGELVDDRDGQTYKTVTIDTQTWMAENLNYETANSYCYNDDASNCTKYGRLYTWAAATAACPGGWHLPTRAEFETLFTAVGGQSSAGKMLKSTSGWANKGNGTDVFGFSALPAGNRANDGDYFSEGSSEGYGAGFWSSTENGSDDAYLMRLYYDYDSAYLSLNVKNFGFSVRCLKD